MGKTVRPLPGKIAVEDIMHHTCSIYDNSDTARLTFKIRTEADVGYAGFTWLHNRDLFVGSEYIPGKKRSDFEGNISVFDLHGNMMERLYEAKPGEIAGLTHPSRTDKYLLFTTDTVGDFEKNPFEGLARMNTIVIMDLLKKKVIRSVQNVGTIPAFEIHESPWLFDETAARAGFKELR